MEAKLKSEIEALPTPATTFEELEAMNCKPIGFKVRKKVVIMIAAVLVLLLCGAGWAKMQYGMWYLYGFKSWEEFQRTEEKYDLVFPESLNGTPFLEYDVWGLVPQGAPWVVALTNPSYKPRCVDYAVEVIETETYPSGELRSETTRRIDELSLHYGTTENGLWRYYFQFDENGVWTACEVPESYYTIAYKGITIQVGDTTFYDDYRGCDRYTRWVHWVDEERRVVVSINETDYTDPNRVVECAKQIIDLNS